tara:strand:- start:2696 stop:3226 length:531 start_codon:yes stop_codon:yes gene_type:complete
MKFKKTDEFKKFMSINPIVKYKYLNLPQNMINPSEEELNKVMKGRKIKTWGRLNKQHQGLDPHWICINFKKRKKAPLHTDPLYPRYSHHLKIRVDDGIECGGLPEDYPQFPKGEKRKTIKMKRGLWYVLDTHSPHQVYSTKDGSIWNLAISIDSHIVLDITKCLDMCLIYSKRGLL